MKQIRQERAVTFCSAREMQNFINPLSPLVSIHSCTTYEQNLFAWKLDLLWKHGWSIPIKSKYCDMNNFHQKLTIKQKHLAAYMNMNHAKSLKDKQKRCVRKYNNITKRTWETNRPLGQNNQTVIVNFSRALIYLNSFF